MKVRSISLQVLLASLVVATAGPAFALGRARTDGPEGSEFGAGGYVRPGGNRVSLGVDWGASLTEGHCAPPMLLGAKLAWWVDNWLQTEVSGTYLFQNKSIEVLVGPRFRTTFQPVGASIGLKGGTILLPYPDKPDVYRPLFALSPQAGLDLLVSDAIVRDLTYSLDIDVSGLEAVAQRLFMTVGYRF